MALFGNINNTQMQNIEVKCEKCGVRQYHDALFCHRCGVRLKKPTFCPVCRRADTNDSVYCEKCGTLLERLDEKSNVQIDSDEDADCEKDKLSETKTELTQPNYYYSSDVWQDG